MPTAVVALYYIAAALGITATEALLRWLFGDAFEWPQALTLALEQQTIDEAGADKQQHGEEESQQRATGRRR